MQPPQIVSAHYYKSFRQISSKVTTNNGRCRSAVGRRRTRMKMGAIGPYQRQQKKTRSKSTAHLIFVGIKGRLGLEVDQLPDRLVIFISWYIRLLLFEPSSTLPATGLVQVFLPLVSVSHTSHNVPESVKRNRLQNPAVKADVRIEIALSFDQRCRDGDDRNAAFGRRVIIP